jgi:hypothetical protein
MMPGDQFSKLSNNAKPSSPPIVLWIICRTKLQLNHVAFSEPQAALNMSLPCAEIVYLNIVEQLLKKLSYIKLRLDVIDVVSPGFRQSKPTQQSEQKHHDADACNIWH